MASEDKTKVSFVNYLEYVTSHSHEHLQRYGVNLAVRFYLMLILISLSFHKDSKIFLPKEYLINIGLVHTT